MLQSPYMLFPALPFPCFEFPTTKEKPYFPCKVLEAKMVEREDAFKYIFYTN
jgi:hypothetical protein